jgi:predicted membrane channel-forming protein YqfA (hemolysin III family)
MIENEFKLARIINDVANLNSYHTVERKINIKYIWLYELFVLFLSKQKTRPMEIIFWILSMCMGLLFGYSFLQEQKDKRILILLIVVSCLWFICGMVMYV